MTPVILVSLDWRRPQDGKTGLGLAPLLPHFKITRCRVKSLKHRSTLPASPSTQCWKNLSQQLLRRE